MLSVSSLFSDVQTHVGRIYEVHNNRLYSVLDLVIHLLRFATVMSKKIRKHKFDDLHKKIAVTTGWVLSIAHRLHIDLAKELLWHFPGVCPYCGEKPCACGKGKVKGRVDLTEHRRHINPQTMKEAQTMLREIYPGNTLSDSVLHLIEEIGEVAVVVHDFGGTHDEKVFEDIKLELVDVIANICAVASCLKIEITDALMLFAHGCPECKSKCCTCTFTHVARVCDDVKK